MLKYQKLPKGTPRWVTHAIFWLGGALGISIAAQSLLALYGMSGFLVTLFYPDSTFAISPREAGFLGVVGVSAALSAVFLSFLGVFMNRLSKNALPASRIVWIPLAVTAVLVFWGHRIEGFNYGIPAVWVLAMFVSIILGGIVPWMVLRNKPVAKVHNK
jgi:hypothetical protein